MCSLSFSISYQRVKVYLHLQYHISQSFYTKRVIRVNHDSWSFVSVMYYESYTYWTIRLLYAQIILLISEIFIFAYLVIFLIHLNSYRNLCGLLAFSNGKSNLLLCRLCLSILMDLLYISFNTYFIAYFFFLLSLLQHNV